MSIRTVNQDWSRLKAGHSVVLIENGLESIATVDAITDDSSVIWILSVHDGQRRAIYYREGVVLVPT
jgi:hypothetical protein